jgi:hypothetical protein
MKNYHKRNAQYLAQLKAEEERAKLPRHARKEA